MTRSSLEFEELTRVAVDCLHKGPHALRVHVRVEAMAQVGDVATCAKRFQHLLHNLRDTLLGHRGDVESDFRHYYGISSITVTWV